MRDARHRQEEKLPRWLLCLFFLSLLAGIAWTWLRAPFKRSSETDQ
jgi:hypothetical protein